MNQTIKPGDCQRMVGGLITQGLIDQNGARLMFLDTSPDICQIYGGNEKATNATRYHDIVYSDGFYYVSDYHFSSDNLRSSTQEVLVYNEDGFPVHTYPVKDFFVQNGDEENGLYSIVSLKPCHNGAYALCSSADYKIRVVRVAADSAVVLKTFQLDNDGELFADMAYNESSETLGYVTSLGSIFCCRDDNISRVKTAGSYDEICNTVTVLDDGTVRGSVTASEGVEGTFSYAVLLGIRIFGFWISILWLIGNGLYFLISYIVFAIRRHKTARLWKALGCVLGAIVIILVSVFCGRFSANTALEKQSAALRDEVSALVENPDCRLGTQLEKFDTPLRAAENGFYTCMDSLFEDDSYNSNAYYKLYRISDQDTVQFVGSSVKFNLGKMVHPDEMLDESVRKDLDAGNVLMQEYIDFNGSVLSGTAALRNSSGQVTGYIEKVNYVGAVYSDRVQLIIKALIVLSAVCISIVILFMVIKNLIAASAKRRELRESHHSHPELAHHRTIRFLVTFITRFDTVLMILIARKMLSSANAPFNHSFFFIVPAILATFGIFIGRFFGKKLLSKMRIKKYVALFGILGLIFYLATAWTVQAGDFLFYSIGLFFANIFSGIICMPSEVLPDLIHISRDFDLKSDESFAGMSATFLSIVIAGFVSEFFGNGAVYLVVLLPLLFIILIYGRSARKHTVYKNTSREAEISSRRLSRSFVLSPLMLLLIVFLALPVTAVTGYSSSLFPLFVESQGYGAAFISNLVALFTLAAVAISKSVRVSLRHTDHWNRIVLLGLAEGLALLNFYLNASVVSAALAIVVITIADRVIEPAVNVVWSRYANSKGYDVDSLKPVSSYWRNFSLRFRFIIIGLFLCFPMPQACIFLGVYILASVLLFALISFSSSLRKKKRHHG